MTPFINLFVENGFGATGWELTLSIGCMAAALPMLLFPRLLRTDVLLAMGTMFVIYFLQWKTIGYIVTNGVVYLLVARRIKIETSNPVDLRSRWGWAIKALTLLLLSFIGGKAWFFEWNNITYAAFLWSFYFWTQIRLFSFLWEYGAGRIDQLDAKSFTIWITLPFTFNGPFLPYSSFHKYLADATQKNTFPPSIGKQGWKKLSVGMLMVVTSALFYNLDWNWRYGPSAELDGFSRLRKLAGTFFLFPWHCYFLWGGYFKMMEALGPAWRIPLPQSFNFPYFRRNIAEFWRNWNITLTSFFRDHFMFNRWGGRTVHLYFNIMVTFVMCGLFHVSNLQWLYWGILQGAAVCAFTFYRRHLAPRITFSMGRAGPAIAGIITYIYVCLSYDLPGRLVTITTTQYQHWIQRVGQLSLNQ